MNDDIEKWVSGAALQLCMLDALKDHEDMDKAYYRNQIGELVSAMPTVLLEAVANFLESEAGKAWLEKLQFYSIVDPYVPE